MHNGEFQPDPDGPVQWIRAKHAQRKVTQSGYSVPAKGGDGRLGGGKVRHKVPASRRSALPPQRRVTRLVDLTTGRSRMIDYQPPEN